MTLALLLPPCGAVLEVTPLPMLRECCFVMVCCRCGSRAGSGACLRILRW